MLSIQECKKHLDEQDEYDEKQIEQIRNFLYKIAKRIIEREIKNETNN